MTKALNKKAILISLLHLAASFFTDRIFFSYWNIQGLGNIVRMIAFKGLFLFLLLLIWHLIFHIIKQIREHKADKTWISCSVGYFAILLTLTLLTWPGLWEWDEFYIVEAAQRLHIHVWQSMMSGIIYIMSLMLIPFPAGIVIVQIILVSVITGYVLSFLFKELECNLPGKIILWLPFLLIPVLYHAMAPIRLGLYSFLELLFLIELYKLYKHSSWTVPETLINVFLVSVIATWRTEAIYYIVIAPILVWLFMKKESARRKTAIVFSIVMLTIFQYGIQSFGYHKTTNDDYELTAYVNSLQELVGYASSDRYPSPVITDSIDKIDRVFDTDILIANYNKGLPGIDAFWNDDVVKPHGSAALKDMKKAYIDLIKEYPLVFLRERSRMYLDSNALLHPSIDLFSNDEDIVVNFRTYPLTQPINQVIRYNVVNFMEQDSNPRIHNIIFNSIFFQAVILLSITASVIKRKWGIAGILLLSFMRIPLIFITAPDRYFMYYFPNYLVGAAVFAIWFRSRQNASVLS